MSLLSRDLQLRDFSEKLEKYGMSVASNQIEYSLINRDREEDGTLEECKRLGEYQGSQQRQKRQVEAPASFIRRLDIDR